MKGEIMRINWKLRLKNKVTLLSAVLLLLDIIYNILTMCGLTPPLSESDVASVCERVIEFLAIIGIVTDPTTAGIGDSYRAMAYDAPKGKDVMDKPELDDFYFEDGDEDGEQ